MRADLRLPLTSLILASMVLWTGQQSLFADIIYHNNTGANTTLDTATFTPTAPGAIIQNYGEGAAFAAGDVIAFNNAITAATTFRISATTGTNLSVGGLVVGNSFNAALLNPGGAITIQNGAGATGSPVANTLTLGAGGIDLSLATQNLTISQDTANGSSLTVTTSADQTWTNRTGRTISLAAAPLTLANNLTLQGAGTFTFGGNATGPISGAGNLVINGAQSGGATVVNLSGTNTGWTGAVTVGASSLLRTGVQLNIDQSAASQNKLADAAALTINHSTVNLQGTGTGTEVVGSVAFGQGLSSITRSAGTGVLRMNAITRATGAGVNFNVASIADTDTSNTANGILGGWAVLANGDWAMSGAAAADTAITAYAGYTTQNALNSWTVASQNILMNATGTASTASRTISSLKIAHTTATTAVTADIGAGNTLTINDLGNGGGILRNQNGATTIGNATVGVGSITAGTIDDSVNDTLYIWNTTNTMSINNVIKDNNTGVGTDTLHVFSGGAGTVNINADNTYTGGTTIGAGTLNIGGNSAASDVADLGSGAVTNFGTLQYNKTAAATVAQQTIANNITGTGAFTVARGTAILSGSNDYSGATTVTLGTLKAGSSTGLSSNSRMILNVAGVTLDMNGFDGSVAALRGDQTTANVNLGTNTLTLSGSDLANSGSAEILSLVPQNYQGAFSATAGNLIKNGAYTQVFTAGGAAAYTGATTVNAGVLQTNKALSTSGLTVNNTAIATSLGGFSTFVSNIANSLSPTASVNLANAGSTWQINAGFNQSIGTLTGAADSRVTLGNAATNLTATDLVGGTFGGVISGAGSFTKDGTGALILTGGNSYTGATTITSGTVQVGTTNAVQVINDRSAVSIGATGVLDLNGNSETIGSLAGVAGAGVLMGAGSLTLGLDNTSTGYAGTITAGAGGLNKVGTGTQTLSGANTFTGSVNISNVGGQTGGGLTIGVGGSLADTVNVRISGNGTTYGVNATDTQGAVTGTRNTTLAIGTGAVLTGTYTNTVGVAGSATADTDSTAGRIVRLDGSITNPQVGMLVSGTSIPVGAYIVQVLDANHVLLNSQPTPTTTNTALTPTTVNILNSAITDLGGFTKDGAGLLILTGNSTNSGATTITNGDVQIGGTWTGQKYSLHDTLSDNSAFVFAAAGTQNLNFANSATNLLSFERVGSLAGGSVTTTINLTVGSNVGNLAFGGDNTSTTFSGRFLPATSAGTLIKEGTGTFTWNNPTGDVYDGILEIRGGGFTTASQGLDGAQVVRMENSSGTLATTFTSGVTDTLALIEGGAGVSRVQPNTGFTGALYGNYLSGVAPSVVISPATIMTVSSATSSGFNGTISGNALTKAGANTWSLFGTMSISGETQITTGTLRTGVLSGSSGVGTPTAGLTGTLSSASGLRITGGALDINSTAQTLLRINATSTGGTIQLVNGSLTLADQNTQTTGTVVTGNLASVLNINSTVAAQTLSLTGNSTNFGGTINVGTNAALTLNRTGGAINSTTAAAAARINLNGTGTQLTVTLADTIGSLAGGGNAVLTQALTLREARSGTVSATAYSGATSGAGALILSNYGGLTVSGNLAHTGGTTLSSGATLNLAYGGGNNIIPTTGALTLNGAQVQIFSTVVTPTKLENAASTTLNAGASNISSWTNFTADDATYQGSGVGYIGLGTITRAAGGMLNLTNLNTAAASNANVNGILGGWFTLCESTWAVGDGANTAAITGLGAGAYSADVFGVGLHVDITAAGVNAGGAANDLRFSGTNVTDITGATAITTGGILNTISVGTNTSTISGALSSTDNELKIHQYNPLGDLILSNVAGTNTIITTAGGGKTQITNSIAGTGTTNIGYGYLQLGDSTVGGSTAGMVGSGAILNNGTLGINRSNAQSFGTAIISGTGNIEQLGTGTTTLGGVNTYQGRTTVRGGTLEITNNAGLGAAATAVTNRWANLTSVNSGGTLLVNVAAGGAVTEVLNLDGGTLDLRSTVATTLGAPIILTSDSTISVSNPGAAVNHIITGEIYALPGSDLTFTNVGGATPSTLLLTPTATTGSRWENTTIGAGALVGVGNNTRGFLGTGSVSNAGTLTFNNNDAFYVVNNTITGAGGVTVLRGTTGNTYFTGDLSGFSGPLIAAANLAANVNNGVDLGNDTYGNSFGTGSITITSGGTVATGGITTLRTHFNQDVTMANTINLNPAHDGTNAKNATFQRLGLGNVELTGTVNIGLSTAGLGTQRSVIQTEAGGKLFLNATLAGGGASNLLNVVNNNIIVIGGSVSNTYSGVLSGNSVWVFNNSGTTTLTGVNTVNSANSYLRQGTLVLGTGGVDTWQNDGDLHVLGSSTLNIAGNETFDVLYSQRGSTVNIAVGATLTLDGAASQLNAAQFTGAGNLTLAANNFMVMYPNVANTISGNLNINQGAIASTNLTNALGSFSTITIGSAALNGGLEYTGPGETFAKNLTLAGTGSNYIAANGSGALILSGNLTSTGATSTLRLVGQTGGYFNPITNRVDGIISDGANALSIAMTNSADDDRFGISSRWALTNASNDFSGSVTVNVGMLELAGDLKTGVETTTVLGDLTATRTITLGSNNFNGRRYDSFGNTDQLGDAGFAQGTNTITPSGDVGTIIFNDTTGAGTVTFGSNISWAMVNTTTTNTTGAQLINNGTKNIIINGTFSTNTTGTHNIVLDGSNTGTNTINSALANPATSQTTAVIKEGAGTWRLGGTNTYTGATTINNGILELAGGSAIADAQTVAISGGGGDGLFSGVAKLRVVNSETIGLLTGNVLTEAEILVGQTLTIAAGNSTMNGLITGAGNLSRTVAGATGGTLTTSASNTYSGITTLGSTGTATANAGISITQLADGLLASGLGSSSNAAGNLVFVSNATNGGILTWTGLVSQSTDRLFTVNTSAATAAVAATITASGTLVGTNQPAMSWTNTGAIVYAGTAGTKTIVLTGTGIADNVFRPQITNDGANAVTLNKTAAGMWLINPDVAGNTYSGGTNITGGTLAIQAGNALGSGTIAIAGGAGTGLQLRSGITVANNVTNASDLGGLMAFSGANTISGTVNLNTGTGAVGMRISALGGSSLTLSNAVSGGTPAANAALIKYGAGDLTLSATNTYTGQTSVFGGKLILDFATTDTTKLSAAAALNLGAAGQTTILGVDDNVGGQTYILGNAGGTVVLNGGTFAQTVLSTTLSTGANAISRTGGGSATINLNAITRAVNNGATIDFSAGSIATTDNLNGTTNATAAHNILNTTGGGAGTATSAYATVAKTDWATTAAAGTDILITALAAGAYNNGGAIETFGAGFNTDIISAAAATTGTRTGTLRFNAAQASTLSLGAGFAGAGAGIGLDSGGILVTPNVGAFDTIINGAALQNGIITAADLVIHQHNTGGALQIDSVIQNNTVAQGLTKTGAGMVYLNAVNTFTGTVFLNEGSLQVGGTAAAPTTATAASLGANNAITMADGTTLTFLSTSGTAQDLGIFTGGGTINIGHSGTMVGNNTQTILLNDANVGVQNINVNSGILRIAGNNGALGDVRGITTLRGGTTLEMNDATARTWAEQITYNQGNPDDASAVVNITNTGSAAVTHTLSGKQTLNNSTVGGVNFNIIAPTVGSTVGLNVTGIMYGTNGFTKSGNGILQISANNFADVYDGYTGINKTPTLLGQIQVNAGILYVGGTRALGAFGAGNETIAAAGASIDLRGNALALNDDSNASREIIKIAGTGFVNAQANNTGSLRNTTGTGTISFLTLDASSLINSGGTVNASALNINTFDTNLSNANGLTGAFTRNRPVIDGGGFDLTIAGGRVATDNFVIADPTFSSALGNLVIREGGTRLRHEVSAVVAPVGLSGVTDITGVLEIGYGGTTAADLTGASAASTGSFLGANVGARFQFENWYATAHTVDITMNGVLAAAATGTPGGAFSLAGGQNYLSVDFFTIPDGTTYLNGDLNLTGNAIRNIIQNDSIGNYSVVEQGNLTGAPATKLVFGGIAQGTGGFTKIGSGDVRFTNANTFQGDVNVLRFGTSALPWETHTYKINGVDYATNGLAEGWAEFSLTLNGANGAFTDVGNITLQRRGMLTLDNTGRLDATSGVAGANNNNRIADDAVLNLEHGWFRINTGSVAANTEVLGTVNNNSGTNIIDLYGTDGAGMATDLTITTLNRTAGSVLRIVNLDATSTFSTAVVGDSARVAVGTLGAGAALIGGGGAANTSTMSIAQGIFGGNIAMDLTTDLRVLGFNNGNISDLWNQQRNLQFAAGSHFMTMEGGFLRPLDNDEYFSPTGGGLLNPTTLVNTNQNVNLSDVMTIMSENSTINALRFGALTDHDGTGATSGFIDHHTIVLNVDGTLTINSGMISSAYWTVGNTASATTAIIGGVLDFNGKEAILNNQSAFYNLTAGVISGGQFEVHSIISNAAGLTKTGFQQIVLDGANTYSGVTTVSDGILFLRHGRSALGVGGAGNGVVINGNGGLNSGNGIVVGTPGAREDIYIGVLQGSNQVVRTDNDVTVWNSNIVVDNVDISAQPLFTPIIRADNGATAIFNGNITGGNTAISNDVLGIDPRRLSFNSAGNNVFIFRGQFGDHFDAGTGNAIPIADPISLLPTLAGTRTNENEVLRVDLGGGSLETNYIMDRQYNAAGRLTLESGTLIANYDPAAGDGTGFWTNTAISKIPNADSTSTTFTVNGGTVFQGFILGTTTGTGVNNGNTGLFLSRAGQVFNMASWTMAGTGAKYIGGINETGTVTYGNGTGSLTAAGATPNFYAADGGTVVFDQRITGNVGTAPSSFGFVKQGRGNVILQNTALATAGDANFVLAGGTLTLNHTGATVQALVGNLNARFDGGTLISTASSAANTTTAFATNAAADRVLNFSIGGTEIVARTTNTGTARNMVINMGNTDANGTTSNFTRGLGATANLVEDNAAGGTAQITLEFNASSSAAVKNQAIAWATYGTLSRTATDFAMADVGNGNDVRAYTRALDEYQNNVASWGANWDVSENGGSGFSGSLGGALTLSTLRFDANADSSVNLGTNVLTVAGGGLATSGGGILVSSNVGSANKTITGTGAAAITTTGGRSELIIHQYGTGNLNLNVPITGAINLTIAGPSTTNAATIGTTGAVVLNGANTYSGQTFINGSVLSISDVSQLGTNATATAIQMNGGTLRFTGSNFQSLGTKGIVFNGNGGTIDVTDGGGELYVDELIASNAQFRGDLIKVGAGSLTLNGNSGNNAGFLGLIDVRQGTLRVNGNVGNAAAGTITPLGTSNSYADGTIFRTGTNFAIQFGNANDTGDFNLDEWLTFEGVNYVSVGTINTQTGNVSVTPGFTDPNNERPVNLNGIITIKGAVTFDTVPGQVLRLNNGGVGYTTGSGTVIKDGQGTMQLQANSPDFTGAITILQGRLTGVGTADPLGTGYTVANGSKVITLGSDSRQGIAELAITSDNIQGATTELNHAVNVVYNPAQAKRILFETFANGSQIEVNGDITLNDNLNIYINDGAETGGSQNYVNINSKLRDGGTTSGNIILSADEADGTASNATAGRTYNYLVLKNDNSTWTGDIRVSSNTSYDQDQTAILRLEHASALGAANDVDMGFNSMLQVGGGARTIGSLSTNGGAGPFTGDTAGGTMGASTNGTTVVIENAATTAGTLTITQSTPVSTEVVWNAYFRDGKLNSEFFAPGAGPTASAALNIVKDGTGWATLALDNDHTGTTTVTNGILQVGRASVGDTGRVGGTANRFTSNAGTTVAGTGLIQGNTAVANAIQINGNLRPGDEAGALMGTLTFNGNTTLGATSVSTFQAQRSSYTAMNQVGYNNASYGTWISAIPTDATYSHMLNDPVTTAQHDKVIVTGGLTTAAGSKIVLANNGYNPTAGDVFNLLDWVGVLGGSWNVGGTAGAYGGLLRTGAETGTDLDLFELGSDFRWDVSLFNTNGIVVVVVPEPSRMVLLFLGLMGLFFRRRRKGSL